MASDTKKTSALIAAGSNLPRRDDRPQETIALALDLLEEAQPVRVLAASRLYRSAAVPAGSGPDFVNGAARVESPLAPHALLQALHAVEARLGRVRDRRWGPRVIDLDLLAVDDLVLPDADTEAAWRTLGPEAAARAAPDELILPHPRMAERAFVLAPLDEVAPDWRHPVLGLTVREMLAALPAGDRAAVRPLPAHPQVLRAADLGPRGRDSTTRHVVGGVPQQRFHRLQIVRLPGGTGVELRYLDGRGHEVTDTWHACLADAFHQARAEFGLTEEDWRRPLLAGLGSDPA